MTTHSFLEYEVALLLAKYGKDAFLNAIAQRIDVTPQELEALLERMARQKPASTPRKKKPVMELAEKIVHGNPEKANFLRMLLLRFQSRTFLPERRDVKRFFEQHSRNLTPAKSRSESLPRLMRVLSELDVAELDRLCQTQTDNSYSELGLISDEILRRDNVRKVGS